MRPSPELRPTGQWGISPLENAPLKMLTVINSPFVVSVVICSFWVFLGFKDQNVD